MKKCSTKSCCGKCKGKKGKVHILPVLALLTCFQLLAPKSIKKTIPGKALKYSLAFAWGGIALFHILKITKVLRKKK